MRRLSPLLLACLILSPAAARGARREPVVFGGWQLTERDREQPEDGDFLYDAGTLRAGAMGIAAGLGFPYIAVDGAVGTSERTDLRLSIRALYGLMSQVAIEGRLRLLALEGAQPLNLALRAGGSYAFYPAQRVAMAISGTRDAGALFGLAVSTGGVRGAIFFAEVSVEVAFDLHPESQALGGLPPPYAALVNVPLHAGVELRISRSFHLTSVLGIDGHFESKYRRGEPAVMPYVLVLLDVLH